jgi:SAM-dependent methyltransferase
MARCVSCGTGYFTDAEPVIGYDHKGFGETYWFNYVQSGAGISAMLEPLLAIDRPLPARLLDVGCGFGFVPHFWQDCGLGDAVGLETSAYGAMGAEKLGIRVVPRYYADARELDGERFDYVFSCEVIEHVENPAAFVTEIAAALAEGGILVLTTPSATALTAARPFIDVLAALSPDFHYFVASRDGLADLLARAGFAHVEVRDLGHRLFAWASHSPLPPLKDGFGDWPAYLGYLERLSHNDDPHVAGGALYRAFKDAQNLGEFEIAERLLPRFAALAKARYGVDFDDIAASAVRRRARQVLGSEECPSWLGCGLYHAGMMARRLDAPAAQQVALFAASVETMHQEIALGGQFAGEPTAFLDPARRALVEATAALAAGSVTMPDPMPAYILRHPGPVAGRDLCLIAVYAPHGRVTQITARHVRLLVENGFAVTVCLAVEDATAAVDIANLDAAHGIIVRQNGGMDFASWAATLRLLPEAWGARRLAFTNDSIIALPSLFGAFADRLRAETADYVALTESHQIRHHAQSYFFMLQGKALQDRQVREFWNSMPVLSRKLDVIVEYETRLLERATAEWGLTTAILYPFATLFPGARADEVMSLNVSHTYWEHLVHSGLPFVKVELLRDNPLRLSILHWRTVLARHGACVPDVEAHLSAPRSVRPPAADPAPEPAPDVEAAAAVAQPGPVVPEWRIILSELNRIRLGIRRRRRARRSAAPGT